MTVCKHCHVKIVRARGNRNDTKGFRGYTHAPYRGLRYRYCWSAGDVPGVPVNQQAEPATTERKSP